MVHIESITNISCMQGHDEVMGVGRSVTHPAFAKTIGSSIAY